MPRRRIEISVKELERLLAHVIKRDGPHRECGECKAAYPVTPDHHMPDCMYRKLKEEINAS